MNEEEIFLAALECPSAEDRAAYLDKVCGGDASVRGRIEALLQRHYEASQFLESPVIATGDPVAAGKTKAGSRSNDGETLPELETRFLEFLSPSSNPQALGQLGQYEIHEVIGRGGMGIVLRGVDAKLNRVVAIKVLSPDYASNPSAHKRFLREAQAVAAVSHDHIVTIHAVEEQPIPHLVMEYIDGKSLQQKINEVGQLELKEILRIGRQIATGLAAAHQQGLTHRDIKPSNILLQNGIQRVQITDFGLARATSDIDITRTGEIAGTPQYMSPEQARSEPVDPRSDLFSLGSVLYAMCCGRSPFRADTPYGSIKRVCEDQPRRIRENNPEIPAWLEEIIFRLLEKDPDQRFQSATEVAELLSRHLSHLQDPAATEFPGRLQPYRRPASTWRTSTALPLRIPVAAVVLLLALLTFGLTEASGVTQLTGTVIRLVTGEGTLIIEVDDPTIEVSLDGKELSIKGSGIQELKLRPGDYQFQATKDGRPVEQKLVSISHGDREVVRVSMDQQTTRRVLGDRTREQTEAKRFTGHEWAVYGVAITPDGKTAISVSGDCRINFWDIETGDVVDSIYDPEFYCMSMAISPDGQWLALGSNEGEIRILNLVDKSIRSCLGHQELITDMGLVFWKETLVSASHDNTIRQWEIETGKEIRSEILSVERFVLGVSTIPEINFALVTAGNKTALWNLEDGSFNDGSFEENLGPEVRTWTSAITPNRKRAVIGCNDGAIRLVDLEHGRTIRRIPAHTTAVSFLEVTQDGRHSVSTGWDKTIKFIELSSGKTVAEIKADTHCLRRFALSPDGRQLLTAGGDYYDKELKKWNGDGDYSVRLWDLPESVWPQESSDSETGEPTSQEVIDLAHELATQGKWLEAIAAFDKAYAMSDEETLPTLSGWHYMFPKTLCILAGNHNRLKPWVEDDYRYCLENESLPARTASLALFLGLLGKEPVLPNQAFQELYGELKEQAAQDTHPFWVNLYGLAQGLLQYRQGNYAQALETLQWSNKNSPDHDAVTHFFRSMAQVQLGQLEQAKQSYDTAVKLQTLNVPPRDAQVYDEAHWHTLWYNWAVYDIAHEQAREVLTKQGVSIPANVIQPTSSNKEWTKVELLELAHQLANDGKWKESLAAWIKAHRTPSDGEVHPYGHSAYFIRLIQKVGNDAKARELIIEGYEKSYAAAEEDRHWSIMHLFTAQLGPEVVAAPIQFKELFEEQLSLQEVRELGWNDCFYSLAVGMWEYRRGNLDLALEHLQWDVESVAQFRAVRLFFESMCYAKQGEIAQAKSSYERAVQTQELHVPPRGTKTYADVFQPLWYAWEIYDVAQEEAGNVLMEAGIELPDQPSPVEASTFD